MSMMAAGEYGLMEIELPYTEAEIKAVLREHGRHVVHKGAGPGSLESDETAGLDYIVMTASGIREHLPLLWEVYSNPDVVAEVSGIIGEEVTLRSAENAINLNYVLSGGRYELHYDSVPYTVLVFVTTLPEDAGGKLAVYAREGDSEPAEAFTPKSGVGVVFDGSVTPHGVTPTEHERISMPMMYDPVSQAGETTDDTFSYLYGDNDAS